MLFSESAASLKKMLVSKTMTAYQTLNDSKKLNLAFFLRGKKQPIMMQLKVVQQQCQKNR